MYTIGESLQKTRLGTELEKTRNMVKVFHCVKGCYIEVAGHPSSPLSVGQKAISLICSKTDLD